MPSRENKNRQKNPDEVNEKSFVGNEEQQMESDQQNPGSDTQEDTLDRDTYRSRNLEIEKERD
jgi:hypothetical protein